MKIATLYSPSHKKMLDEYFLPSFMAIKDDNIWVKAVPVPQLAGDHPQFNSEKWKEFMFLKAKFLWDELLDIPEGDIYGFIDVDIINVNPFYNYVMDYIKDVDFIAQSDSPYPHYLNICTGILFFKNNENCRNLLRATYEFLGKMPFKNEQEAFSYFAANRGKYAELKNLTFKLFPFEKAWTYGSISGRIWNNDDFDFKIPNKKDLLWLHANWAEHDQKIPLLDLFKKKLAE